MYSEILKKECDAILFQYKQEFLDLLESGQVISLKEYIKGLELQVEAIEFYEYHQIEINQHFNVDISYTGVTSPIFNNLLKDIIIGVAKLFVKEVKEILKSLKSDLNEEKEDLNYFEERLYLTDSTCDEEISEEERISFINEHKSNIDILYKKIKNTELILNDLKKI